MDKIYTFTIRFGLLIYCAVLLQPLAAQAGDNGDPVNAKTVSSDAALAPQPVIPDHGSPFSKKFLERWEVTSASTTKGGELDPQFMLSPESYFKFLDHERVEFRLNEFYPVQTGKYKQNQVRMDIYVTPEGNCEKCFDHFTIYRNSIQDPELYLEFGGHEQIFTVNQIR